MTTQSFTELIETKRQFLDLLSSLGLTYSDSGRWAETYRLVEKLEKARLNGVIDNIDSETMGRMRFALLDLSELSSIIKSISENDDKVVLKGKFKLLLGGLADRTKETDNNTRARDTQFEMVLNAYFINAKLTSTVTDPHPDLIVDVNGLQYGVECKRVFSASSGPVVRAIRDASSQLKKYYLGDNKVGIVAVGIDRHLTGGNKILESGSELAARVFLSDEIKRFIDEYSHRWSKPEIVGDERIVGILVYMSIVGVVKEEKIPIHATQTGFTHCYWTIYGKQNFAKLERDIAEPLIKNAGEVNEYVRTISKTTEDSK